MQTNKTLMRLIAVVMTVVMMLTAIPFSSFAAADETALTDYVVVGSYKDTAVLWRVLEKKADGSLLLISKDVILNSTSGATATKYNTKNVVPDYEGSNIEKIAGSILAMSDAETAALANVTMSYKAIVNSEVVTKTYAAKYAIPTMADFETYGLKAAAILGGTTPTAYWLADAQAKTTKDTYAMYVTNGGTTASKGVTAANGLRMIISLAADSYVALPEVDGVTYKAGGAEVAYAVVGNTVEIAVDESYNSDSLVVKFGGTAATGTDGVYTVGAGEMTIEGITAKPGDFTAYDAAVAKADALTEANYSAETWAVLAELLAVDASVYTAADQAKIDELAAAIEAAIAGLEAAPANLVEYKAAVARAKELQTSTLHNLNASPEGENKSYNNLITLELRKESTILAYKLDMQAEVDAATKALNDLCDQVPYKKASLEKWTNAVNGARTLDKTMYDPAYVEEVLAAVEALVAANDFSQRTDLDIRNQAEIDAAAAEIEALYADKGDHFIQTDFSALEAALERAAGYAEENFYKDEDVKREEEVGGTAAWTNFTDKVAAAKNYIDNKDKYTKAFDYQASVNTATEQLVAAMDKLDGFVRLNDWDRFVKDVEWFFYDVKYQIDGIIAIFQTVAGLLGMLFRGEIDLYSLFELLDVGEDVLNFLVKIGIKPKDPIDPGADPEAPEAA